MKKTLIFFGGVICSLIILELFLRVVGILYLDKITSRKNDKNIDRSNTKIYFYGDSYTAGSGAPEGLDYPSQLDSILRIKYHKKFSLINRGIATLNTTQVLKKIQDDINKNRPDIIVVLAGGDNFMNYWGYKSFWNNFLYRIRIYKLFRMLTFNLLDKKNDIENEVNEKGKFNNLYKDIQEKVKKNPKDPIAYFKMGVFYAYERDMGKAVEWFKKGIIADPKMGNNYLAITNTYISLPKSNNESLEKWLYKEIKKDSNNYHLINMLSEYNLRMGNNREAMIWEQKSINLLQKGYVKAKGYYFANVEGSFFITPLNNLEKNTKEFEKVRDFPFDQTMNKFSYPNFVVDRNELIEKNHTEIENWAQNDLETIISICSKENIKLILMNYPLNIRETTFKKSSRNINKIIENLAYENKVSFVNNRKLFDDLGDNKPDYFEPIYRGDHPNEKGYGLIAKNIYLKLKEMKIVK